MCVCVCVCVSKAALTAEMSDSYKCVSYVVSVQADPRSDPDLWVGLTS